jgi:hypothetical protein
MVAGNRGSEQAAQVVELLPLLQLPCGHPVRMARPRPCEQKQQSIVARPCPTCQVEYLVQALPKGLQWRVVT